MRFPGSVLALLPAAACAATFSFHVAADDPEPWPQVLSSIGLRQDAPGLTTAARGAVFVVRDTEAGAAEWMARAEQGAFLIVEGDSPMARELGFLPGKKRVVVRNVLDTRRPQLAILWEKPLELPVYAVPGGARLFARERWGGAPLMAGFRKGAGGVLWIAVTPGERGYERFPYLLHALSDLGMKPALRGAPLWAFFDSSYRLRADPDYFAERWRRAGIGALHVAAWHYWEPDPQRDLYLKRLIEACHRRAILVYAWLELPHVSEKFWQDHPEWREKTAILQDAHLDWRRLMNLANRDCFRETARGARALVDRFDWDGVNLAELYFESLEGVSNPARLTPMNDDVRREFRAVHGYDPHALFQGAPEPGRLNQYLVFRTGLARRMQQEWVSEVEGMRSSKPHLDVVLTHVDDRIDPRMKEAIGADSGALLAALGPRDFTFLVEDPATVWHLGPARYTEIAKHYAQAPRPDRLAVDINIAERYQDVYPTRQQSGLELFQLVQTASRAFPRVAIYFEQSLLPTDLGLLPASTAAASKIEQSGTKMLIDSPRPAGIAWKGPAIVDGRLWPVLDGETLWLPAGRHSVEPAMSGPRYRIAAINGGLKTAAVVGEAVEFSYNSSSRALALVEPQPDLVEIDGKYVTADYLAPGVLDLPRGQHLVRLSSR